jgi:hypothetical protein
VVGDRAERPSPALALSRRGPSAGARSTGPRAHGVRRRDTMPVSGGQDRVGSARSPSPLPRRRAGDVRREVVQLAPLRRWGTSGGCAGAPPAEGWGRPTALGPPRSSEGLCAPSFDTCTPPWLSGGRSPGWGRASAGSGCGKSGGPAGTMTSPPTSWRNMAPQTGPLALRCCENSPSPPRGTPARGPVIALACTEVAMKSSQLYRPALREGARAVTVMRGMKIGS